VPGEVTTIDETVQVPPPLVIVLPRPAHIVTISNKEDAGTNLLIAAGWGSPVALLDTINEDNAIFEGGVREIILAGATAVCRFAIFAIFDMEA